ncbi:MAG: hypothetical protein H7832_14140, partial [Magnetococcus sp. DMHC-6]
MAKPNLIHSDAWILAQEGIHMDPQEKSGLKDFKRQVDKLASLYDEPFLPLQPNSRIEAALEAQGEPVQTQRFDQADQAILSAIRKRLTAQKAKVFPHVVEVERPLASQGSEEPENRERLVSLLTQSMLTVRKAAKSSPSIPQKKTPEFPGVVFNKPDPLEDGAVLMLTSELEPCAPIPKVVEPALDLVKPVVLPVQPPIDKKDQAASLERFLAISQQKESIVTVSTEVIPDIFILDEPSDALPSTDGSHLSESIQEVPDSSVDVSAQIAPDDYKPFELPSGPQVVEDILVPEAMEESSDLPPEVAMDFVVTQLSPQETQVMA